MAITTKHQVLAWDLVEGLGDEAHKGVYFRLAKIYDESFLRRILSLVKLAYNEGKIKAGDRGRYFMGILKHELEEINSYSKNYKNAKNTKNNSRMKIFTINNKKEEKFLRNKVADFDFKKFTKKEISELLKTMRETMIEANGIGLSANQISLDLKVFVAQIQELDKYGNSRHLSSQEKKFYAIFNPEIVKFSKEKIVMEEGCLSVPDVYGLVERSEKITLIGQDENGKKIKVKASSILARVFQHEFDHLNGILFIDKAEKIFRINK